MLCRECKKRKKCVTVCQRVDRDLKKRTHYLRETVVTALLTDSFTGGLMSHSGVLRDDPYDVYLNYTWLNSRGVNYLCSQEECASYFAEPSLNFPFLSTFQNKILQLFHFEGKTYKEIAKIVSGNKFKGLRFKTNTQAIKNQIRTVRTKIRKHIKNTETFKNLSN